MSAPPRRSLITVCQTALAAATVTAVSVPALSVVQLDIVPPVAPTVQDEVARTEPVTSMVSTAPVKPKVEDVELDSGKVRLPAPRDEVLTRGIGVDGYATVGVTWAAGPTAYGEDDISLQLRTRSDGAWTAWEEMHYDPAHTPDPGGEAAEEAARPGTDAVVVGAVDKVQVRVRADAGQVPDDLELAVIDPGVDARMERQAPEHETAQTSAAGGDAAPAAALSAAVSRPTIFSRSQWGANEKLRDGSPRYGTINAGFVHHTVNANGYQRDDVPSILRGIYAYHTQSRGWSDVGYNFLVDRFGRIWEGRYGGVARPVIGAHTLGYNEYSFAMSAIGNFDTASPPSAMLAAYAKLFAWKLSLHGVKAGDTHQRLGSRYFAAINGHRDAGQTACPGRYLYAKIPGIRTAAARIQNGSTPPPEPTPTPEPPPPANPATSPVTTVSGSGWPDLVTQRGDGRLMVTRTEGQYRFERSVAALSGWDDKNLLVAAGDLDGDGRGDVIARDPGAGIASMYPGDGDRGFRAAAVDFSRFNPLDQLVGAGDFDGDGNRDLIGRVDATTALRLYPGTGDGGFDRARTLADTWGYDQTVGAGDLDGDGRPDLLGRKAGRLYLVPGARTSLAAPQQLPGDWSAFDLLSGGHDLTGDGVADLVARVRETRLSFIYPGDGAGGFGNRYGTFGAFRGLRWFGVAGRLDAGGAVDLVGVQATRGTLKVVANTGRRNLGVTTPTDVVVDPVATVIAVGDWNRDSHGDLMYRTKGSDRLMFLAGQGDDRFADPVGAGTGWGGVSGLVAAGDLTGDRRPDLLGESAGGGVRVYAGNGGTGFKDDYKATRMTAAAAGDHKGVLHRRSDNSVWWWLPSRSPGPLTGRKVADDGRRYDWFLSLGDVDGNGRPDVVARARANGQLWLLPGASTGLERRRYVGAVSEELVAAAR